MPLFYNLLSHSINCSSVITPDLSSFRLMSTAFEKLLYDLFQDTAWDISSDISDLNTMLAQDGNKNYTIL